MTTTQTLRQSFQGRIQVLTREVATRPHRVNAEAEGFARAIRARPSDNLCVAAFADWAADRGSPLEAYLRRCVGRGPRHRSILRLTQDDWMELVGNHYRLWEWCAWHFDRRRTLDRLLAGLAERAEGVDAAALVAWYGTWIVPGGGPVPTTPRRG